MKTFQISRTNYTVADFLGWQQDGRLKLSPVFQRRSVWTPGHKSYLMDTVVRGLPIPVVFIRDSLSLESKAVIREMVDGQQRIRTIIAYVDPGALPDYDSARDGFVVKYAHNPEIAGKTFDKLSSEIQRQILTYEFSTHVLPLGTEDRDVLQIFARMNSTGVKLNHQELRNAQYFGPFKVLMYELATEQLDRWRSWRIFSEDSISRMKEVELVSDLAINMVYGLSGKSQARINAVYKTFDDDFPGSTILAERFRHVMETIDSHSGADLPRSAWRSEVNFFTLFVLVYGLEFQLGSGLAPVRAARVPGDLRDRLSLVSDRLRRQDVPAKVLDAMQRASSDLGRRRTRYNFVLDAIGAA